MIDTGNYQDDITSLTPLRVTNYERIFKIFKISVEDKDFYHYNILKNIEFPTIDSEHLSYYTVPARSPLTTVSYNIYGDIDSWWILYLLNKDKIADLPLFVEGGTQLQYLNEDFRAMMYFDITQSTVFGNRHY